MKEYIYSSDSGSILLGNENFVCHYFNGYGDGTFSIYIIERGEMPTTNLYFEGIVQGTFNTYGYDCDIGDVLTTLSGSYGIYSDCGTVILEKWE